MPKTIRQILTILLRREECRARDSAVQLQVGEHQVVEHLVHLKHSLKKDMMMLAAQCIGCGYVFRKRTRMDAPGRCPACKGQRIGGPWFRVKA